MATLLVRHAERLVTMRLAVSRGATYPRPRFAATQEAPTGVLELN